MQSLLRSDRIRLRVGLVSGVRAHGGLMQLSRNRKFSNAGNCTYIWMIALLTTRHSLSYAENALRITPSGTVLKRKIGTIYAQLAWPGHRTKIAHTFVDVSSRINRLRSIPSHSIGICGSIRAFGLTDAPLLT
jgi:hypothetical protein